MDAIQATTEVLSNAASVVIAQGILGALTILFATSTAFLVWRLIACHKKQIKQLERANGQ